MKNSSIYCDAKEEYLYTYKGYEVFKVWQVELGTDIPCGSKWFVMRHLIVDDAIFTPFESHIKEDIDYRYKANPNMFRRWYAEKGSICPFLICHISC